jgi:glycosyltransferase involved in cell wall biosynthesis
VLRTTAAAALRLRRHADAVVEIWNGLPFWTPLWWHGPQVAVLHHLHDELWQSNFPKPVAQVGSYIERRVAPRAYRNTPIATLSDSSGLDIAARTALESEQITVVPPGIGDVFKPSRARSTEPLIVAAGRFVPAKRFDAVVTAFAELHRVRPAARLVLVGEGPEREALQSQIRSLGLSGVVELPGWIEESRLIDLYSQAWLLAAASISEGWGMTITEAAACATAAVASDVVGHRDAMKYSEGRLVANDVELAEAMVDLTADADVNGQLGRAARESSKRLSWAATAADVLDLLIGDAERRR